MKKISNAGYRPALSILTVLFCSIQWCSAQDGNLVMQRYQEAISKVQSLSYEVNRIDTFVSGSVWNNTGYCHLRREPRNKLFGFSFLAKRNDIPEQAWYDGQYYFSVNHESKKYGVNRDPSPGVLGSPGGQMVSAELLNADTGYKTISATETADHYILRLQFPDDTAYNVSNRNKLLYLDKKTYLPQRIASYHDQLDKKNVTIHSFTKLVVNDAKSVEQLSDKEFLASYELLVRKTKNELEELLDKQAPEFTAQTFSGQSLSLQQLRGKLVLLDFWEVWCGPCVQSMPKVQALHEKYGNKGLIVLGVTLGKDNLSSSKILAEKKKLTFTNVLGDEGMTKNYKAYEIPEYILIDKSGKIIFAKAGFTDEIEKIIKEKLDG